MAKTSKIVSRKQNASIVEAAAKVAVAVSDPRHSLAVTLAATFDDSENLQNVLQNNLDAQDEIKMGPLTMMLFLQEEYGDDYERFPVPFVKDGNNPGVYTTQVPGKDGISKPKDVSWYKVEFVPTTEKGKELEETIETLTKKLNDPANEEPKLELQQQKATATARLNAFTNLIERSIALDYIMDAINDLPNVECGYFKDADGNPVTSTKPMWVASTIKGESALKCKNMSIGAFLGFDVKVAADNGGTYEALIKTLERGAGAARGKDFKVDNVDHFEALCPELSDYIRDVLKKDKLRKQLVKEVTDDAAFADTITSLHDLFERLMQNTEMQQAIARHKAKQKDAA